MNELRYVPLEEFRRAESLKGSPAARAAVFASLARINTLYMIARAGSGHIGTSFSSMDIVAWLYLDQLDVANDVYFSSKGHDVPALYAILAARGLLEFDKIHALRRLGGLPGHPDVGTPQVAANTGSLGMGISKAKGMAIANGLLKKPGHVYVLTGDGELQEGQFWESLHSAVNRKIAGVTAIIDHNKIQSDTWVKDVSDLGDLPRKLESFGWHVARCDGHDFESLSKTFDALESVTDRPKIVIADTIKGKGVSFMEQIRPGEKLYRFHSGAPDEETYGRAAGELIEAANRRLREAGGAELKLETVARPEKKRAPVVERLVGAYSKALVRAAEANPKVVALDADLVLDCGLIPFADRFPDRFVECGIAEQDMVSQAGGLALRGLLPVAHSFACFLSSRPNEQIYNNATENRKVVYVGSLAGLLPGGPGHSHQCVRDISSLSGVPGLVLVEPSCEREVDLVVDYCLNVSPESCYLRLVSIPVAIPFKLPESYRLQVGRGVALTEGRDAVLISYGPVMLAQACLAAASLSSTHGISVKVINLPWLNRVDRAWLSEIAWDVPWLFTLDNHYLTGGQGEQVLAALAELGLANPPRAHRMGVEEIPVSGGNDEVLRAHGLDADGICRRMLKAMGRSEPA